MKTKFKLSSEWIIFFWCFLIATLFWFLRVLNDNFTTHLKIPVTYVNLPENEIFINSPPDKLYVAVQGPGWELLSLYLKSRKNIIELDLNQYSNVKYFLPNQNLNKVSSQLPIELQIININPDTIFINTDQIAEVKLPVRANIYVSTEKQFGLSAKPDIKPDSIVVSGPKSVVEKIDSINTRFLKFENLTHSVSQKIPLLVNDNNFVKFDHAQVELNIKVEKLTDKTISVPVKIKNIQEGLDIILIPTSTKLTFQTTLSNFDKINESDFEVYVNAENIDTVHTALLEIQVEQFTPFVYSLRTNPKFVNFLIEKKP